ncbi:ATP-binding cassette domain-containing protein [Kiritimatiellaeota bacterium B1221]|nr:ATP-binding cassette domain-containing protein [Kiritimatiellaeota bacterium B1221]
MPTTTDRPRVVECADLLLHPDKEHSIRICPADFSIHSGERWALMGPSGCGKTSLVNALCGLLTPTSGTLKVLGQDLRLLRAGERDRLRGKRLGVVHQNFHLLHGFSALENLLIALRFSADETGRGARKRATEMLASAGLEKRAGTRVERLSRGEAQRVALARALVHRPELLLTDEPTASLDAERGNEMLDWMESLRQEAGCAWLCVTHNPAIADRFDQVLDARNWSAPEGQR